MKIKSVCSTACALLSLCRPPVAVAQAVAGGRQVPARPPAPTLPDEMRADAAGLATPLYVDPDYLHAFGVAYGALMSTPGLSRSAKRLSSYQSIFFSQDARSYYVFFVPRRTLAPQTPGAGHYDSGHASGPEIRYTIRKADFKGTAYNLYAI